MAAAAAGAGLGEPGRAGQRRAGMALDVRRLEALSLQELSTLLDDEEQLQDMAREMDEVRGVPAQPRARAAASPRAAAPLSPPGLAVPPAPLPLAVWGVLMPACPHSRRR